MEVLVDGTIVLPEKFEGRRGRLTFLGDRRMTRDLENPIESRSQPLCVGTLTISGETTGYLGSLPHDMIWHLVGSLSRGEIRMLALHGEGLHTHRNNVMLGIHGRNVLDTSRNRCAKRGAVSVSPIQRTGSEQ